MLTTKSEFFQAFVGTVTVERRVARVPSPPHLPCTVYPLEGESGRTFLGPQIPTMSQGHVSNAGQL